MDLYGRLRTGSAALCAGLVIGVIALLSSAAGAHAATAHRAVGCSIAKIYNKLGPTYVTKLTVSGTTCGGGQRVVTAYNRCRLKAGGVRGHCHARVDGLTCMEKRYAGSPDQFIAAVSCSKPRETVAFVYSEDS
jgi:hypothetical protein